jgi:hypothetical protein
MSSFLFTKCNRLLPTNCVRACTASPTEISYNYSDNPDELYRAEIEFISAEDWKRELEIMFIDLAESSGKDSHDLANEDSDAGIAYAKIKAVYPSQTKEDIAQSNAELLAREPSVHSILGTSKVIQERTASDLYLGLQRYVDSKERTASRNKKTSAHMDYWPLIKVVRIYNKAAALSTGAVIVDLVSCSRLFLRFRPS